MRAATFVPWCLVLLAACCAAQEKTERAGGRSYPPQLPDATAVHTYKKVGDVELKLYVFAPEGHQATHQKPAIVFFFGGGWKNGSPGQFHQQCRYLASRGLVAITADYRVASRHDVKAVDCVRDAKSAIRWVRGHASQLGVHPDKIVASGGSAGGHLAACTGTLKEFDETGEDHSISSRPNALVLFNPAAGLVEGDAASRPNQNSSPERYGVDSKQISPADHVTAETPPTLILIGTEDFLLAGNKRFAAAMKQAGQRCELDLYEGASHGFFNYGRDGNTAFHKTLESTDRFLTSLGYLQGEPKVDAFFGEK